LVWGVKEDLNLATVFIQSVEASPRVVLFSTVKVEMVVAPTLTEPAAVKLLTKTSPSASTKNFTEPLTASPNRLESATALEGLIYNVELATLESATPGDQATKVWAKVGEP